MKKITRDFKSIISFKYYNRFSFVISSRGVVNHVFHPRGENEEVVAIKKGLSSIFAAKLHEEGEVKHLKKTQKYQVHYGVLRFFVVFLF